MFNLFQLLNLHLDLDSYPFNAEILLLKIWIYFFKFLFLTTLMQGISCY